MTQEMGAIPYSFNGITEYPRSQQLPALPGQAQGVYITLHPDVVDDITAKIARWFAGREEIDIVDVGVSDKQGLGFLIIEWSSWPSSETKSWSATTRSMAAIWRNNFHGRTQYW